MEGRVKDLDGHGLPTPSATVGNSIPTSIELALDQIARHSRRDCFSVNPRVHLDPQLGRTGSRYRDPVLVVQRFFGAGR